MGGLEMRKTWKKKNAPLSKVSLSPTSFQKAEPIGKYLTFVMCDSVWLLLQKRQPPGLPHGPPDLPTPGPLPGPPPRATTKPSTGTETARGSQRNHWSLHLCVDTEAGARKGEGCTEVPRTKLGLALVCESRSGAWVRAPLNVSF